jgi:hypothetical protein
VAVVVGQIKEDPRTNKVLLVDLVVEELVVEIILHGKVKQVKQILDQAVAVVLVGLVLLQELVATAVVE